MKKLLIALLCAALGLTASAWAESAPSPVFPTPAPDASESPAPGFQMPAPDASPSQAGGSLRASLNGEPLTLDFDADPLYSTYEGGYVQASFYAYGEADLLYELYVVFPSTVSSGDVIASETAARSGDDQSGLMLFVSDSNSEACSVATQHIGGAFPEGSAYELRFDRVTADGSLYSFTGSLKATLVRVDEQYHSLSETDTLTASFTFTMNLGDASATPAPDGENPPEEGAMPALPFGGVPTPPASLVAPADARKI